MHKLVDMFNYERSFILQDYTQKPIYQRSWFIALALLLGIVLIVKIVGPTEKVETVKNDISSTPFYKKMAKEEFNEKMAQNQSTPEVIAAKIVRKDFGTTNLAKENAVLSSRFENGVVETIALEENFKSAKALKSSILNCTLEFMKAMNALAEVEQATLIVQAPLTDPYGNVENGDIMIILMSRETLNKINFNHFNAKNISAVADSYWEHPALTTNR